MNTVRALDGLRCYRVDLNTKSVSVGTIYDTFDLYDSHDHCYEQPRKMRFRDRDDIGEQASGKVAGDAKDRTRRQASEISSGPRAWPTDRACCPLSISLKARKA